MTNNSRSYEYLTKFCLYVTTGRVFQIALRVRGYFPQQGEQEILVGAKQQPQTKNEYLYTGIINTVFQRFTIFILHASNKILIFFREKLIFLIYFIVLFCPGYVLDFMMHLYDTQFIFFQKWRKLLSQISLDSKLKFLESFSKNKK